MPLYERVFSIFVAIFLVVLLLVVGTPVTVLVRVKLVPLLGDIFFEGLPMAIAAMIFDPLLAISALVVFLFLWSAGLSLLAHQGEKPSNHRRGRVVESKSDVEIQNLLQDRRTARARVTPPPAETPVGVRPRRRRHSRLDTK